MPVGARVGLVLGGLFVAAVLASAGRAQSAPGRIVQSSDGTLYVVKDGARFAIVGDPIDDEELGSLADGGTIGAAELLPASVAAAPAVAIVTNVAPPDVAVVTNAAPPDTAGVTNAAPPAQSPARAKSSATSPAPPQTGEAQVSAPRFMTLQGNAPGKMASVSVQAPPGVSCSISYLTPARTRATASGLDPQTVGPSGVVTWSFLISATTPPGTGSVSVTCGTATITSPLPSAGLSR